MPWALIRPCNPWPPSSGPIFAAFFDFCGQLLYCAQTLRGGHLKRLLSIVLSGAMTLSAASCVFISQRVEVKPLDISQTTAVLSPVKAHLKDGSTIVYLNGVQISGGQLRGSGLRYDLSLASTPVDSVSLDEVVGMESFTTSVNGVQTAVVSSLASVGAVIGTVVLSAAIFGSCPTVYSADGKIDEAELFSSSIAPLFEARDIDSLQAQPGTDGTLRLEIRNEAMETHYINHLQLIEVEHSSDESVVPDQLGHPTLLGAFTPATRVTNRSGADVSAMFAAADNRYYSTDRKTMDRATTADMDDWIDFSATVPTGAEQIAIAFRLRNSLLSTTLLYDVMLGPAGAASIDWLGSNLARIDKAVELGRWHRRRAGLHISVWQDGEYREVTRIPDSGPISWHDVAAVIPVPKGQTSLRLRLSFVADHWRIDRMAVAPVRSDPALRTLQIEQVVGADGKLDSTARESLRGPDDHYLQTTPGQKFFIDFRAGRSSEKSRTFLLSSQGYYTEWIRGSWIQSATVDKPFDPTDEAVLLALKKWAANRDAFEQRFRTARVPVN